MIAQLLRQMNESDVDGVSALIRKEIIDGGQAWAIHLSLFPLVQRVLNPPFINPHLPKMYRICREFLPYLAEDDIPALVRLEITEYTKRPKSRELPKTAIRNLPVSFPEIETAIRAGAYKRVTVLLAAFREQQGEAELARNMLLLGSGYLEQSLGHSVSCTAFILLEMMERSDLDSWPALAALADYFCKGQFHATPSLSKTADLPLEETLNHYMLKATSGSGIVNLHHTITRYAIERVRHLLSDVEYAHVINRWIEFIGSKNIDAPPSIPSEEKVPDYDTFYKVFSKQAETPVLSSLAGMISSEEDRQRMGRYLVKGVCNLYQGNYDPHFLTGLGSVLWVVSQYCKQPPIVVNALRQYLDYFFTQRIYWSLVGGMVHELKMSSDSSQENDKLHIRAARPEELDGVSQLLKEVYQQYENPIPSPVWESYLEDIMDVLNRLDDAELIVAELGGQLVGTVTLYLKASHSSVEGWPRG